MWGRGGTCSNACFATFYNIEQPTTRGKSAAVLKPEVSIGAEPVRMMSMKYQPSAQHDRKKALEQPRERIG